MSESSPLTLFRDRFVVGVHGRAAGTGVLLTPTVVATCHHVLDASSGRAEIRRGPIRADAEVASLTRTGLYDDVAFLVSTIPLARPDWKYPRLLASMTHEGFRSVEKLLRDSGALFSFGVHGREVKASSVSLGGYEISTLDHLDWYQLQQGQAQGRSGGPVWLMPPEDSPAGEPGTVLGLIAQGAAKADSGGTPHSFAVTSDTMLKLRERLCGHDSGLPAHRKASLLRIRTVDVGSARKTLERHVRLSSSLSEITAYRRVIRERHQYLKLIGFDEGVRVKIQLDELDMELDMVLDHGPSGRAVFDTAAHAQRDSTTIPRRRPVALATAFELALREGKRGLVLLGDPGSGKTTQLERILLRLLSTEDVDDPARKIGLPAGTVPVFLSLRNLRGAPNLRELMERELAGSSGRLGPSVAHRLLEQPHLLFLFDGLDEVADEKARGEIARWIQRLHDEVPNWYFLVTSRYAGYSKDVELRDFLELYLRPLTEEQVQRFVSNWYRLVNEPEARLDGVEPDPGGARALLEAIHEPDFRGETRLWELTGNPLLLTAICLVHRKRRGRLPSDREALYRECIHVLLKACRQRNPNWPFSVEEAECMLRPVAHWMHRKEGRIQASAGELEAPLVVGLAAAGADRLDPTELLRWIRDESGLLTGWGVDRYGFMHLGLQEYLAAMDLRSVARRDPSVLLGLARCFDRGWWQEVILLMLAGGQHQLFDDFMGYVVANPRFVDWADTPMMDRILGLRGGTTAKPFVDLLREQTHDESHEARQLAAVRLLHRWRPLVLDSELDELLPVHPSEAIRLWWRDVLEKKRQLPDRMVARRGSYELVRIPGGRFMMGSPPEEEGRDACEGPRHEVTLSPFYMGHSPVTNAQYAEYMRDRPSVRTPAWWGNRHYNAPDQPVVGITWGEAREYCAWAGLELPTEAQWEYACRAGTTTRYHSGDSIANLHEAGWSEEISGNRLHSVGERAPNAFWLLDMHGNVQEWCLDEWHDGYGAIQRRPNDGLVPGSSQRHDRVVRGGSWVDPAQRTRSASRECRSVDDRSVAVGFRPVAASK